MSGDIIGDGNVSLFGIGFFRRWGVRVWARMDGMAWRERCPPTLPPWKWKRTMRTIRTAESTELIGSSLSVPHVYTHTRCELRRLEKKVAPELVMSNHSLDTQYPILEDLDT
jgi:hypothetical protein